jgi:DHA3 family tetracycline resistance protein-like MFS transporter
VAQPLLPRFERLGRDGMACVLLVLDATLVGATLAFALAGSFALAVAALWTVEVARSLSYPVYDTWRNANIEESSVRATVISITNLGDSTGQWAGGPVLGAIGSVVSIGAALATGALVLTPALWLYGRRSSSAGPRRSLV